MIIPGIEGEVLVRSDAHCGWEWQNHPDFGPSYCDGSCHNVLEHIQFTFSKFRSRYPQKDANRILAFYLRPESYRALERLSVAPARTVAVMSTGPVICKRCYYKNDYGANNQPDGSYVCYMCR